MNFKKYFDTQRRKIEKALTGYLPPANGGRAGVTPPLEEAMRYAVLSGGKRVRPILTLAACEAVGGKAQDALPAAAAVEFIHSYSLVHDDLPCMDDSDTRRSKPTCHKKFGQASAVLAGDALLTLAFRILSDTRQVKNAVDLRRRCLAASRIAEAAGVHGMVGGQAFDMHYKGREVNLPTLEFINTHKSGDLIAASVEAGALVGGATKVQYAALSRFGRIVGLLFQIVDDILDGEGYAKLIGLSDTRERARELSLRAKRCLRPFGRGAAALSAIADFIVERTH